MQEGEDFPGPKVGVLSGRKGQSFRGTFFGRRTAAALPALAATALLANQIPTWLDARHTYTTGLGELRSVTLGDGSIMQLNAQSSLRTRFTAGERRVDLTAGEAVFRVSKDATRPFRVHTNDAVIQAVGTQFNVNARSDMTIVTVIEGRVSVSSPSSDSAAGVGPKLPTPLISAGEQITVQPKRTIAKATRVDPEKVTGWTVRRLYFDDTPLSEAAQQFTHYSPQIIHIEDPSLGERRISGTFDSSDPAALVQFLERYGHTTAIKTDHGWTLDRAPPDDRH